MIEESHAVEQPEESLDAPPKQKPEKASWREKGIVFLVMALVLLADHLSKLYVESRLPLNTTWVPFPGWESFFRITHVSNTGAAFGIFQSGSLILSIVAVVVSVVIILYNRQLPAHLYWYRFALGLQLGGALGNLLSRMRIGHVTDFLDFGPVPVFNVADMSIVSGTILLGFLMIFYPPDTPSDGDGDKGETDETMADGSDDGVEPEDAAVEGQGLILNE